MAKSMTTWDMRRSMQLAGYARMLFVAAPTPRSVGVWLVVDLERRRRWVQVVTPVCLPAARQV